MSCNGACGKPKTTQEDMTIDKALIVGFLNTMEKMQETQFKVAEQNRIAVESATKRVLYVVLCIFSVFAMMFGSLLYVYETGEFELGFTDEIVTTNTVDQDSNSGSITQGDITFGGDEKWQGKQ